MCKGLGGQGYGKNKNIKGGAQEECVCGIYIPHI